MCKTQLQCNKSDEMQRNAKKPAHWPPSFYQAICIDTKIYNVLDKKV